MIDMIQQAAAIVRSSVALEVDAYFASVGVSPDHVEKADVVLALLRINTQESLGVAEKLMGKKITQCPPAVPPWPPKPVAKSPDPAVCAVGRNTFLPTTPAFQRFRCVRRGLTREQLKTRGVTQRDITQWTRSGHIKWSTA